MAYVNGDILAPHGTISNFNIVGATNGYQSIFGRYNITQSERATLYSSVIPLDYLSMQIGDFIMGDNTLGLKVSDIVTSISGKTVYLTVVENGTDTIYGITLAGTRTAYPRRVDTFTLFTAIDEETQKGCIFINFCQDENASAVQQANSIDTTGTKSGGDYPYSLTTRGVNNLMYRLIKADVAITYTWSSVPAISGKNGTLSLTQILNINDGEPVEDITNKGNLDFSKKTKVNTLVNSVYEPTYKEDATKASVEYEIPEAEYQYTKLVYKKKKIPKSANDGTAIDIGADDTEAFVSGLEENTTYYFVVFTNRTKSNAYKFKTGKNAPPEGIFKIRITTSQGVKDNDFKEVITIAKQ